MAEDEVSGFQLAGLCIICCNVSCFTWNWYLCCSQWWKTENNKVNFQLQYIVHVPVVNLTRATIVISKFEEEIYY